MKIECLQILVLIVKLNAGESWWFYCRNHGMESVLILAGYGQNLLRRSLVGDC